MSELLNRIEMLERLNKNIVEVRFTKANGELRTMRATLMPSQLPPSNHITRDRSSNDEAGQTTLVVWDVDKQDWRSFRLDSVTHVITPAPTHPTQSREIIQSVPRAPLAGQLPTKEEVRKGYVDFAAILRS